MIHVGDCLEVMPTLPAESVDAIVTDPPYNLTSIVQRFGKEGAAPVKDGAFGGRYGRLARGFMGKAWDGDGIAFRPETWEAVLRVAKPGAYLLAFGGTRTVHRMTCAIEDAGWAIRDMLVWAYASGFPKSRASLKPAWEPIVMARKPGPLRDLAIDKCRIGWADENEAAATNERVRPNSRGQNHVGAVMNRPNAPTVNVSPLGRWPANVILTDEIFDGGVPGVVGGGEATTNSTGRNAPADYAHGGVHGWRTSTTEPYAGDTGTYSRFFLLPKASRSERERGMEGAPQSVINITEGHGRGPVNTSKGDGTGIRENRARGNTHPTVKPLDLMRHLVRLVTPTGGTVLDPFLGSGTTAIAADLEGFKWIGIEREADYAVIAEARLEGWRADAERARAGRGQDAFAWAE